MVFRQPADYLAFGAVLLVLVGLLSIAYGFGRLFIQAWKRPDRWPSIWKVLNVQPRRNAEWPNRTPEADYIAFGALIEAVVILCFLAVLFASFARQ